MKRLLPRPPRRRTKRPQGTEAPSAAVHTPAAQPAVPAGAEPSDPSAPPAPSFRNRGRLRRRMRFLRRVRELGFRDLGGLVFDQHKFHRPNEELVRGKLSALAAVDAELRALEHALGERREVIELREPGISACPRCGTLHGSDARFCPSCGLALTGARVVAADVGEGVHRAGAPSPPPPEASPGATFTGEREAAKAEAGGTPNGSAGSDQPTVVARPGSDKREP